MSMEIDRESNPLQNKNLTTRLQAAIDEFKNSFIKSRELYIKIVEIAHEDGFNDYELDIILKHHLKDVVHKRMLQRYSHDILNLSTKKRHLTQIADKNVIEQSNTNNSNKHKTIIIDADSSEIDEDAIIMTKQQVIKFRGNLTIDMSRMAEHDMMQFKLDKTNNSINYKII